MAWSKYLVFIKLAFLKAMAFRWEVFWSIITSVLMVVFYKFLWISIFGGRDEIAGMTIDEIINYYLLGQIIAVVTASRVDRNISREIMNGNILNRLIRPTHVYFQCLFEEAGLVLKNAVFTGLPIIIISFLVIDVYYPAKLNLFLFLFISIVLAFLLKMNINFLAGLSACWIRGSEGVTHFKDFVLQICSGAILPLSFYPRLIEQFFMYLPFKFIVYVPIQVFQGKYSYTELQQLMLVAVLWVIVLTLLNISLLNKGIRRVTIFGG